MRTFVACAGAAAVLMAVGPARAEVTDNPYFNAGLRLYADLEYESALEQLKKAATYPGNTPEMDVKVLVYLGLVRFELGEFSAAESDFKTALALDLTAQLPGKVSPKVSASFEKARAQMARKAAQKGTSGSGTRTAGAGDRDGAKKPSDLPVKSGGTRVSNAPWQDDPPMPLPPPVVAKRKSDRIAPLATWILFGASAALSGGGVAFGMGSTSSVDAGNASTFQSDRAGYFDRANDQALAANVMYGTAAAAAIAGVVVWLVDGP